MGPPTIRPRTAAARAEKGVARLSAHHLEKSAKMVDLLQQFDADDHARSRQPVNPFDDTEGPLEPVRLVHRYPTSGHRCYRLTMVWERF